MNKNLLKKIASLALSSTILLNMTSCGIKNNSKEEKLSTVKTYLSLLDDIEITYENEEYYPDDKRLETFIQDSKNQGECEYQISDDLNIEIDNLINQIKLNSVNYLKDNPTYYYDITEYKGEDWLSYINNKGTDELLRYCLERVFFNATNDINEDFCYLQGLTFVFSNEEDGPLGKYIDTDKIIIVYYHKLIKEFEKEINSNDKNEDIGLKFYNYISIAIEHELNHARQQRCQHKENPNRINNDISYCDPFITTLIEASAESALYNLAIDEDTTSKNTDSYTYPDHRFNEMLLFLLGLQNEKIEDYYNAVYDADTTKLYNFFGLETEEDIKLFYKILYAIDSQSLRTDLLKKILGVKDSFTIGEIMDAVGYNYRADLFKLILKNLVEYTQNNPDFSLEENINIFTIVSNYIVYRAGELHFFDDNSLGYKYDIDLINAIKELEETYINFLCEYYNTNIDEIESLKNDNYIKEIIDLLNNENIAENEKCNKAKALIERFPILKNINFVLNIPIYSYNDFLEDISKDPTYSDQYKLSLSK